MGPAAKLGDGVAVAPGAVIHDGARIGGGSSIGAGSVVHSGVELGDGCTVEDLVVLGKRPRLRAGSSAEFGAELGSLVIDDGVTICCGAIVYAGARIGAGAIIGDQAQVRERSVVGPGTVVGRASAVDFAAIVGARVRIQTDVYVTAHTVVEDDVFLAPGVVTTNDQTMSRHSRGDALRGPTFRRGCRVGARAVVLPGIEIGEEALVAAGAVVTRDVPARQVVMGVPARVVREVADEELFERWH